MDRQNHKDVDDFCSFVIGSPEDAFYKIEVEKPGKHHYSYRGDSSCWAGQLFKHLDESNADKRGPRSLFYVYSLLLRSGWSCTHLVLLSFLDDDVDDVTLERRERGTERESEWVSERASA